MVCAEFEAPQPSVFTSVARGFSPRHIACFGDEVQVGVYRYEAHSPSSPRKPFIIPCVALLRSSFSYGSSHSHSHSSSATMSPVTPPPSTSFAKITYPADGVLLVTYNRPEKLNCTRAADVVELTKIFQWFDDEATLSVAIITGAGDRAFSTGADLSEWQSKISAPGAKPGAGPGDVPGAIPLSNRTGKKPIIAAVNGLALGGGCETVVNCDIVVAADTATFGLVEVKRGVAPYAGVLPRLTRTLGLQRASELALTGVTFSAAQAHAWSLVNSVVPRAHLLDEALRYAKLIASNSPDSIICTRAGLRQGWETASVVEATRITNQNEWAALQRGENIVEGLRAFQERRQPRWRPSKL